MSANHDGGGKRVWRRRWIAAVLGAALTGVAVVVMAVAGLLPTQAKIGNPPPPPPSFPTGMGAPPNPSAQPLAPPTESAFLPTNR